VRPLRALALGLAAAACGGGGTDATGPGALAPRSYALGFTDFPHERSFEAVAAAQRVVRSDGDLIALHFDDGVPWQEALLGTPYPAGFQQDLERRAASVPAGHVRYLAVTPIAFARNGLAPRRGEAGSQPLEPPWDRRSFDHPEVVAAFTAHCERMITIFSPHYFAYAIEANILERLAPGEWPAFVRLAGAVFASVKAAHPALPVFLTLQADHFHADPARQARAIAEVLPYADLLALSAYPFTEQPDPRALPPDLFSALAGLAPGKRLAIAETGWPAETVSAPYPVPIPADDETQRLYVEHLLGEADRLGAAFVVWFFTRDYDGFWESQIQFAPEAALLRLWKDCGLYAGDGRARPGLAAWRRALARPR
jgi:hypothetical protein